MAIKNKSYSKLTGLKKSIKNTVIMFGVPAAILLINNWQDWVPIEHHEVVAVVIGFISYFVKNYVQNKNN